ncbi:hypothetical protein ACEZ6Q_004451 [Salmonella enterica]|jgi:hypothetical protein|uniref:hypothetical protein n=1 Tax=Citrobacter freundii complex TaxID=1344959 RepID=UPI00127524C4|nr:hypothetical protein [Citrobacter cronae]EAV1590971.1 hypothetical protein [Salmonella enterica]EBQ9479067.1 hypothetical protein [Salmonella enterica subsp. enterica serovar Kokomlemle]EDB5955438.1 hypothetical protein [Salmonella enterica subsp. enterica serovar Bareilly]EDX4491610.1 hypothetical protein [Salmonella enterica subsp. salamae]EBA4459014.1 hypothetical protein [Salmonella enterica]
MAMEFYGALYPQDGVSDYLKVTLTNSKYSVSGYLSQGAAMNIAQSWEAPFSGMNLGSISGTIGGAAQIATGLTSVARWNSLMVWEGGTPPTLTLPIIFLAQFNPFIEVSGAIAALSAMVSPQLKDVNKPLKPEGRIPEKVTLNIGRRIMLVDIIIQDMSFDLDAPRSSTGLFLRNTVNLQLSGATIYNSSDFIGAFQ